MIALWIILGVLVLFGLIVWAIHTSLVKLRNNADEAFSTMDVCMKKRYDLIPNLVETVKGYAKHEQETLEKVIAARNMAYSANTTEGKQEAEKNLASSLKSVFALAESYPDLKANTNFIDLQEQLKSIETEIANSRRYYNACVKTLNTKLEIFPSNIIGKWFHFEKKELFVVDSAEERKNVKVSF